MDNQELCFMPIAQLADHLRERAISPVEVTRAYLDRIQSLDRGLNSYLTVTAEQALQDAKTAEADILRGHYRGSLHGVPLAHKDIMATKGIRTTCASKVLAEAVPDRNASVIERLEHAGAILLGKLNMNEFATIVPSAFFGRVYNPWNRHHTPGGSSSGSGAAVAAGLCAGSLGSDTAGSIRIPAAFCGIVGLKPTFGRTSLAGVIPVSWSLDHVGPMTRTVKDAALMLQAVAGYDPLDDHASRNLVPDFTEKLTGDVRGLVIGVPESFFPEYTDPEVSNAFDNAIGVLSGLGATIREVKLPSLEGAWARLASPILNSEAYTWHEPYLQEQAADYGPIVRALLERGRGTSAMDYIRAQRSRVRFRQEMLAACADIDVLMTPGELIPAPLLTTRSAVIKGREVPLAAVIISATGPFNLTGQPAMIVPCGFTSTGLPLALQIVGKPFAEATVLQVGHAYEVHTPWHEQRPVTG